MVVRSFNTRTQAEYFRDEVKAAGGHTVSNTKRVIIGKGVGGSQIVEYRVYYYTRK